MSRSGTRPALRTATPLPVDLTAVTRALGRGQLVVDRVFDEVFPIGVRRASSVHWTPVEVAMRASRLLAAEPGTRILDVGSGVGKFCLVAAAATGAEVRGVEHRAHFVDIARAAAATLGVTATFVHGTLAEQDVAAVDALYLFNPYAENLAAQDDHLDETVELSEERFWRDLAMTERFLHEARVGTRVVTYCGFGGEMPAPYVLVLRERCAGTLDLWVKTDRVERREPVSPDLAIGTTTLRAMRERALRVGATIPDDGDD